jgi:hypothetical protein
MPHDRRSFIRRFGITLGSLIASGSLPGCGDKKEGESSKTASQVKKQDKPSPTPRPAEWEQLRQCWLKLNNEQSIRSTMEKSYREADRQRNSPTGEYDPFAIGKDALAKEHQTILDTLLATGQVNKSVSEHMQEAFEEAAYHVVRRRATCYLVFPFEYTVRKDLLQQADVLGKICGDLDPAVVAKAQAAIAQDVAYFEIFNGSNRGYVRSLRDGYEAGNLKASPEALEAAHLLAQLFLETPG